MLDKLRLKIKDFILKRFDKLYVITLKEVNNVRVINEVLTEKVDELKEAAFEERQQLLKIIIAVVSQYGGEVLVDKNFVDYVIDKSGELLIDISQDKEGNLSLKTSLKEEKEQEENAN